MVRATTKKPTTKTPTNRIPCARCSAVLKCDGLDWPTVNALVNKHWAICPRSISPTAATTPSPSRLSVESLGVGGHNHDQFIVGDSSKLRRNGDERKQELENDEYACEVTPESIRCRACGELLQLDKRWVYHDFLWNRHKDRCKRVQEMELAKRDFDGDSMSMLNHDVHVDSWMMGEKSWTYRYATEKEIMEHRYSSSTKDPDNDYRHDFQCPEAGRVAGSLS
ncbi:hypothetical protein DEU56DRAFT_791804 [Suillus clintonianus]|uniref:uncharacterized protein n=1 Tax=Suillus clintonianus TaxID=1904413 RepID=UPI001B87F3F7|nr:uncharacterized protein DEU56DRAFT_791804 [Suillus clintonianus]KAG2143659.1 hypothetical protein DEU56DRAFT_791804 [Suillus clintonianus]